MSQASETTAIVDAINAQFATSRAVAPDDAAAQTSDHIIVFVSRRYVADRLASGEVTIPGGRVVTRYASTNAANISNSQTKARAALEDKILSGDIGPFVFETEHPIKDGGDGWWTADDVWTY